MAAYNLVIQNYPKGDQVPWAYYKRGLAQGRLRQRRAARASFEQAMKKFPETEPAIMALSRLRACSARRRRRHAEAVTCPVT